MGIRPEASGPPFEKSYQLKRFKRASTGWLFRKYNFLCYWDLIDFYGLCPHPSVQDNRIEGLNFIPLLQISPLPDPPERSRLARGAQGITTQMKKVATVAAG
jgi:hypothetical protein